MTNKEFVIDVCHCENGGCVNYRPCKDGSLVKRVSIDEAVSFIEQTAGELKELGLTNEQIIESARKIFKEHILVFH